MAKHSTIVIQQLPPPAILQTVTAPPAPPPATGTIDTITGSSWYHAAHDAIAPAIPWLTSPIVIGCAGFAMIWLQLPRLVEYEAVAASHTHEAIERATIALEEFRRWNAAQYLIIRYCKLSDAQFERWSNRTLERSFWFQERSVRLFRQADRAGRLTPQFYVRAIVRRGNLRQSQAFEIQRKRLFIIEFRNAWSAMQGPEQQRRKPDSSAGTQECSTQQAEFWLTILENSDARAPQALKSLNAMRHKIDWASMIPDHWPATTRDRGLKLLSVIAGTDNIHEARESLKAFRLLERKFGRQKQGEPA